MLYHAGRNNHTAIVVRPIRIVFLSIYRPKYYSELSIPQIQLQCLYEKIRKTIAPSSRSKTGRPIGRPDDLFLRVVLYQNYLACQQRPDQIESRVIEDPYQVDEMPVNSCCFHRIILLVVQAAPGIQVHDHQEDQTCDYVEGMHAGHHEKDRAIRAAARRYTLTDGSRPFHCVLHPVEIPDPGQR